MKKLIFAGARLSGDGGAFLLIDEVSCIDRDFIYASAHVTGDWLNALVWFEVSIERLNEFILELDSILNKGVGKANFINEIGNFDIDIELTKIGKVNLFLTVSKNMADRHLIKFGFESENTSLHYFLGNLKELSIVCGNSV
jgi:hypothetical protein